MKSISLYELNNLVRCTLESTLYDNFWVRAEISSLQYNRHCYLELVQKDEFGHGIVAKARAQVWANKWYLLKSHFEQVTHQSLSAGMEVLVQVEITFHELYGYSLNIIDIDPTYTLGDIARKRMEIIQTLKDEGVYDMNKELPLPRLLQRIAVISSPTAAGYGDFCDQLHNNKFGLAFHTRLFPAIMQGNEVENSVISALNSIAEEHDKWDVVVIIRGGGSVTDLSGFDTLALGENVAQFPLPIITGIGHERDDTVIDLVSHTRVKTPTAAAEFLIHHQKAELSSLEDLEERMYASTSLILQREKQRLELITHKFPTLFELVKQKEYSRLDRTWMTLQTLIIQKTTTEKAQLEYKQQRLQSATDSMLTALKHRLDLIDAKLDSANPQKILNLGFSITRIDGKAVTDATTVTKGQTIETTLKSGTIKSTIK